MAHKSHLHKETTVACVYYARVPEGSGSLFFEDPRPRLPPFDGNLVDAPPKEGEALCFPGWLRHGVSTTKQGGNGPRVSFSCNIGAQWGLGDVNVGL